VKWMLRLYLVAMTLFLSITPLPGWMTIPEAARRLGLSEWTLRKEIRAGRLKVRRVGRVVRVLDAELARWMTGEAS